MAIELYATAGSVEKDLRNHVVIVVDVLRATSVMVTAVEHGVRFIIPVSEVEEADAGKQAVFTVAGTDEDSQDSVT